MNELERKIDAVLDAGEPENRLAELRERLARLLKLSALDADRLEVYREKVERQLDAVDRMRPITDRNWRAAHDRLSDAADLMRDAWLEVPLKRDKKRQDGTRKPRTARWPDLDNWIRENWKPGITAKQLWKRLPDSYDGEPFYCDGPEIVEAESERTLGFSGFAKRVAKVKK